ncbi:DUF3325 domain-containing protein [Reyranella sp.]|jgi:hypothetical protein|uniref:DUF3325 domain-containing protein n=1 Tax=Reyranella sp. TaxID=1929291 RepID=UPI00271732A1|nr:DUF3325 domain-containing protein [Reyranella sp.]MDO8974505.1 DUF3325 domain-containing protein [Reyranella sp.]
MQAVLIAAVLAVSYLGFAFLALSQDRHWLHFSGERHCPPRIARSLRIAGYALLIVGLGLALFRDGAGFGSLVWGTTLTVGSFAVVCTLTWRPYWLRPLALVCQRLARRAVES